MYHLARCQIVWVKDIFIRRVIARYDIDMTEAMQTDITAFANFNAFFTRELQPDCRPIAAGDSTLVSPVDGTISEIGHLGQDGMIRAKCHTYTVLSLLGGDVELAKKFDRGRFVTIYLSPRNYHRVHMPLTGKLQQMRYVPGRLFSVKPRTVSVIPSLFARNERLINVFLTHQGPLAIVMVGAIFVGSMETVWAGQVTPPTGTAIQNLYYDNEQAMTLQKGEEMGRFNMGSTVVMLLPEQAPEFTSNLTMGMAIKMGQAVT